MKKVLLIGDIGVGAQGFYHIGDELMFFYNYKVLENHGYEVFATSRGKESRYNTVFDINFSGFCRSLKLGTILMFHQFFTENSATRKIIEIIKSVDDIIFSGGGNLNSMWRGHLYYRFLITYFAKKYKKNIYLSSQTIGPIRGKLDSKMLDYILDYCKIISIRDFSFSKKYIKDKFRHKVKYFLDDALIKLNYSKNKKSQRINNVFNVGLSVHEGEDNSILLNQLFQIQQTLKSLYGAVKFYKIPHMFDNNGGYDEKFMKSINFINYENEFSPELYKSEIEELYEDMDFIITTRYHGGVLAIKYKKPVIMIGRNDYELGKFCGLRDTLDVENYILLSNIGEIIDGENIKFIINKDSSIKYNKNKFFIYNYINNYDKDSVNKTDGVKKQ